MSAGLTIEILLKERSDLLDRTAPLRSQIAELQERLAATLSDIGPIEALLKSRGWKPDQNADTKQVDPAAKAPGILPDYSALALEWIQSTSALNVTTRDFSDWLKENSRVPEEPARDSIRNAFKNLEKDKLIELIQQGQGRRPTVYIVNANI